MQEKIENVLALIGGCAIFGVDMIKQGAKPLTDKVSAEVRAALDEIASLACLRSRRLFGKFCNLFIVDAVKYIA